MITDKKFAVLITSYNGSDYLERTVRHIQLAILESNINIDTYLYDDNSTDNSIEIVENNWDTAISNVFISKNVSNIGLFGNKNYALKHLSKSYDWVFFMHQDDFPSADWIKTIIGVIEKTSNSKTFCIWSSYGCIDASQTLILDTGDYSGRIVLNEPNYETIKRYIMAIYTPYCISGSCINLKLVESIDFFDSRFSHFGDTDFIVRGMRNNYNQIYIGLPLITRTISSGQASYRHKKSALDIKEMFIFYKKNSSFLIKNDKTKFKKFLLHLICKKFLSNIFYMNIKSATICYKTFIDILKQK